MSEELKLEEVLELAHGTYSMRDDLANRFLLLQDELNRQESQDQSKALTVDELAGILYHNSTDDSEDGKWIEEREYRKIAKLIHAALPAQSKELDIEIKRPKNFNNWPTVWQSCFNDGVEACKAALPSETAKDQRIMELEFKLSLAEKRSIYWKNEHLAGNETIAAMQSQINELKSDLEHAEITRDTQLCAQETDFIQERNELKRQIDAWRNAAQRIKENE